VILAGDVGGTKSDLALFAEKDGALELVELKTYRSLDHASLDDIVADFASGRADRLTAAVLGVAGPAVDGHVRTINLPWEVDAAQLASHLGLGKVELLHDIETQAWSVERLAAGDLLTLQEGTPATGNVAVIAAGNGLGYSALVRAPGGTVSLGSEGGHADFAPRSELECELLNELRSRFEHVTMERVLSRPGLLNVYLFLRDSGRGEQPLWLTEALALQQGDASAVIAPAAFTLVHRMPKMKQTAIGGLM
jgi:glucokinase